MRVVLQWARQVMGRRGHGDTPGGRCGKARTDDNLGGKYFGRCRLEQRTPPSSTDRTEMRRPKMRQRRLLPGQFVGGRRACRGGKHLAQRSGPDLGRPAQ